MIQIQKNQQDQGLLLNQHLFLAFVMFQYHNAARGMFICYFLLRIRPLHILEKITLFVQEYSNIIIVYN